MVTVHTLGRPSAPTVEVALSNHPAGVQQKYQLAVAVIPKIETEFLQLWFREDTSAVKRLHDFVDTLARRFVEKPEPRHGGVVHCKIILGHSQPELRHLADQVGLLHHWGHAMVGAHHE